ncbi:MAG: DUF6265 family protein, partial [Acidobacteria bacterium]|nr:DUF6265 family protein [Acidobacteriota bacterium]
MRTLLLLCLFSALVLSAASAPDPGPDLNALSWMAGSWRMETPNVTIEEQWMEPAGKLMLGMSRTTSKRGVFFEFLRVEARSDGVYYVAQPKGGAPTDFKLVRHSANEAVFENLAHDFPKRILYRLVSATELTARVEGDASSKEQPQEFQYKRA